MECLVYSEVVVPDMKVDVIEAIAKKVLVKLKRKKSQLSIHLVSEKKIAKLNFQYRRLNKPTDVLSFSMEDGVPAGQGNELGDIFLSPAYIRRQARDFGVTFQEEMCRMLIHGILHACGYLHDAPEEAEEMFALQENMVLSARKLIT